MALITELEGQGTILTLAVSLGFLGNISVVTSICRKRRLLQNNHYCLILQLAICDLSYLSFFVSSIYSSFAAKSFLNSTILCKIWGPTQTMFCTAGTNILVLISVLRYRAVIHPLKPAVSRRTLRKLSACVYVLAVICVIPYVLVLRYDKTSGCNEQWPFKSLNVVYTLFLSSVQYFIPVAFLSVIYFKICKKLVTRNNWIHRLNVENQIQQEITWFQRRKLQFTKPFVVSFTIVLCFVISACPIQVAWVVSVISTKEITSYYAGLNAFNLFGTTVIHPYVYGALDSKVFFPCTRGRRSVI